MNIGPGLAAGNVPIWDGTKWVPADPTSGSVTITIQSLLGRKRVRWVSIEDGTLGISIPSGYWTAPSSVVGQPITWASAWLSVEKSVTISPAAAGSSIEWRGAGGRGFALSSTVAWGGGFYFYCRHGVHTTQASARSFFGFKAGIAAIPNADPSAMTDVIGYGNDSADGNLQIMHNDAAGTCTKVDLGASFPAQSSQTDVFEMVMFCAPGQTSAVQYQCTHVFSGAVASGTLGGAGNLPTANTEMFPRVWLNNGTTAAVVRSGLAQLYVQGDY